MAQATPEHTPKRTSRRKRGALSNPPKAAASSNWLSIVKEVFPQWCDRLGSSSDGADAVYDLLCDRDTRCAKHRVDASGKEIPGTASFVDGFWPDHRDCLVVLPDASGGDQDRLVIDYGDDIYWDDYSPGWRWEFYVRRLDVARWEQVHPELAASPPKELKVRLPKKKRRKAKSAPAKTKRRGPKATIITRVVGAMKTDIAEGMSLAELEAMSDKELEEKYSAKRERVRAARQLVIDELKK
jgi:hypothetical protein